MVLRCALQSDVLRCGDDASTVVAPTYSSAAAEALTAELLAAPLAVTGFCAAGSAARATRPVAGAVTGAHVSGADVVVSMRVLQLSDVIRNGNATFRAELHTAAPAATVAPAVSAAEGACPQACISCINGGGGAGCMSQCSACSDTCTTCVKYSGGTACATRCQSGQQVQCTLADVIEGHCSAAADWTHSWSGWTLVSDDGRTIFKDGIFDVDAEIKCASCHAHLTPSLEVNIKVENNALQALDITVTGAYSAVANVTATVTKQFSKSGSTSLSAPSIPSINFFLGAFPVHISFDIDVAATYDISATAQAQAYSGGASRALRSESLPRSIRCANSPSFMQSPSMATSRAESPITPAAARSPCGARRSTPASSAPAAPSAGTRRLRRRSSRR